MTQRVSPLEAEQMNKLMPGLLYSLYGAAACTSASAFVHLRFLLSKLIIFLPVGVLILFSNRGSGNGAFDS